MMKFILDRSLCDLGIESVVIGIAKNVNPHAELSPAFLKKKKEREPETPRRTRRKTVCRGVSGSLFAMIQIRA